MKVSELTGAALDYWVARAEGKEGVAISAEDNNCYINCMPIMGGFIPGNVFRPSSVWDHGGPIIEREKIATGYSELRGWGADTQDDTPYRWYGPTLLIAAMRAYVSLKFGEEVTKS